MDFRKLLYILIAISLVSVSLPLILYQLPEYVINGDVAHTYQYSFLTSKDIKYAAYSFYTRLLYTVVAELSLFGIGNVLYAIIFLSIVLFVFGIYKISQKLTNDKKVSQIAAFLSLNIFVFSSGNFGFPPVTQTVALTLFVWTIYFFVSGRSILSGLTLGTYAMVHPSFPLVVVMILLYTLLKFKEDKSYIKKLAITVLVALFLALPFYWFLLNNQIHSGFSVNQRIIYSAPNFSLISYLWVFSPPLIFLAGLYAAYKYRSGTGYKFLSYWFILIIVFSQSYLFDLPSILPLLIDAPRVLTFALIPLSILGAMVLSKVDGGKLLVLCLAIMIFSQYQYHTDINAFKQKLSTDDLDIIKYFQNSESYDNMILYNPIERYGKGHLITVMGGQSDPDIFFNPATSYWMLSRKNIDNFYPIKYVLAKREDKVMKGFIDSNNIEEVYNNDKYILYKTKNSEKINFQLNLEDYANAFTVFYNQHDKAKAFISKFNEDVVVEFRSRDTGEHICLNVSTEMTIEQCASKTNFVVTADMIYLKDLFTAYSINNFAYEVLRFYSDGKIELDPDISQLKFIGKVLRWVRFDSPGSYPNVLFGALYAITN